VDWINLAHVRNKWQTVLNRVTNFRFSLNVKNFLTTRTITIFQNSARWIQLATRSPNCISSSSIGTTTRCGVLACRAISFHFFLCHQLYLTAYPSYYIVYCGRSFLHLQNIKEYGFSTFLPPIPVAARTKAWVFGLSLPVIVGSNPAGGMDVCLLWLACLCVGLITRLEQPYRKCCVFNCDHEASMQGRQRPYYGPKRHRGKICSYQMLVSTSQSARCHNPPRPQNESLSLWKQETLWNCKGIGGRWRSITVFNWSHETVPLCNST
jgi:hypothetical protein